MWKTLRELSKKLGIKKDIEDVEKGLRKAAVVVLLSVEEGEYKLLFVRRSRSLAYHRGQVSFPGGGFDSKDRDLLDTALRELEEETGIDRKSVDMFFSLGCVMPVTSPYCVLPFVAGLKEDAVLRPAIGEIEECFWIPLRFFYDTSFEVGKLDVGSEVLYFPVYYFNGKKIWGMTARIVVSLLPLLRPLVRQVDR